MNFNICDHQLFNTGVLGVMTHPYFTILLCVATLAVIIMCIYRAVVDGSDYRFAYILIVLFLGLLVLPMSVNNIDRTFVLQAKADEMFKDCK